MEQTRSGALGTTLTLLAVFVLLLPGKEAFGQGVIEKTVQDRVVKFHVPAGDCLLDADDPSDAKVLLSTKAALRGVGDSVIVFADCRELDYWRRGLQKTLDDYGYAYAQRKQPGESDPIDQRLLNGRILAGSKQASRQTFEAARQRVEDNLKRWGKALPSGGMEYMGILDGNTDGLYMGNLQDMTIAGGEVKTMAGVWTVLALNRRVINAYFFRRLKGVETIDGLVRDAKEYARRAHKLNQAKPL